MGRRSNSLADRIEQGAAELAKFAESLSDADWKKPGSAAGTDKRPVGVIVHHVANMYPIEIDVAKTIASGKAITDVTWDAVAGINAGHAKDQARHEGGGPRVPAQEQPEAAAAMRRLHRRAAGHGRALLLSWRPVTAQFVIEDHALRTPAPPPPTPRLAAAQLSGFVAADDSRSVVFFGAVGRGLAPPG
jgi:hypothetical protein